MNKSGTSYQRNIINFRGWWKTAFDFVNKCDVDNEAAEKLFIQILYHGSFESKHNEFNITDCQPTHFIKNLKNELTLLEN